MTATTQKRPANQSERLSALEVDVRHLDGRLDTLSKELHAGFDAINRNISNSKQPLTAFAGWAAVILSLVYAYGSPLIETDHRIRQKMDVDDIRELQDARFFGVIEERFKTLQGSLDAAVMNRKDQDAKHESARASLDRRIDELSHQLDNGLGRRIQDAADPLIERIIAIERSVFNTSPNERDMDRK